jgi:hypothetical protein
LWTRLFGSDEVALRSLTVFLGGLAVPVMALLGRRLFGRTAGLVSALLLAISPFFVHYEQTARSYALVVLLVLLSSYLFVRELEQPSRATRVGYVVVSALAIYAHYFAALVVLVQLLALLGVKRRAALTWKWLIAAEAIAILCIPEAVFAIRKGPRGIDWIPPPSLHDLIRLPADVAGGMVLLIALVSLGCYAVLRAIADRGAGRLWRVGFVTAWFVVPVILYLRCLEARPAAVRPVLPDHRAARPLAACGRRPREVAQPSCGNPRLGVADHMLGSRDRRLVHAAKSGGLPRRGALRPGTRAAGDRIIYDPVFLSSEFAYYAALSGKSELKEIELGSRPLRIWLALRSGTPPPKISQLTAGAYAPLGISPAFSNPTVTLYRRTPSDTPSASDVVGKDGLNPSAVAACLKAAGAQVSGPKPAGLGTVVYATTPDGAVVGVVKAPAGATVDGLQQAFSGPDGGFVTETLSNDPTAFGIYKGVVTIADSTMLVRCT